MHLVTVRASVLLLGVIATAPADSSTIGKQPLLETTLDRKELFLCVGLCLRKVGFKGTGPYWYRSLPQVVQGINLQKSQYSDFYYVNIFFGLSPVELARPKEYKADVRVRLECLYEDERKVLSAVFDLKTTIPDSVRQAEITRVIRCKILPVFDLLTDHSSIAAAYVNGQLPALVRSEAQTLLGVRDPYA